MSLYTVDGDGEFCVIDLAALRGARLRGRVVEVLFDTTWLTLHEIPQGGRENPELEAYELYSALVNAWKDHR